MPRINLGPCGPFAEAFYDQWNALFRNKITIVFIMLNNTNPPICPHILVKLPDGSYFDGGNGVMTESVLLMQFPNCRIEDMKEFKLSLLEKNSGGLSRKYKYCPNYSNDLTIKLIKKYLTILSMLSIDKVAAKMTLRLYRQIDDNINKNQTEILSQIASVSQFDFFNILRTRLYCNDPQS